MSKQSSLASAVKWVAILLIVISALGVKPAQASVTVSPRLAVSLNDFVITVKTDNSGTSTSTQFIIPTYSGETYN